APPFIIQINHFQDVATGAWWCNRGSPSPPVVRRRSSAVD
ncbi:hypothetical protein A2U01_0117858, partial [Trifolium medium]|nr:hypothetical protein [Trifolium medium]